MSIDRQLFLALALAYTVCEFVPRTCPTLRSGRDFAGHRRLHIFLVFALSWLFSGVFIFILGALAAAVAHRLADGLVRSFERRLPDPSEFPPDGTDDYPLPPGLSLRRGLARHGEVVAYVGRHVLHGVCLLVIATLFAGDRGLLPSLPSRILWVRLFGYDVLRLMVLAAGLLVTVRGAGHLIALLLVRTGCDDTGGIPDGGRLIGYLERALVFVFVVIGQPQGIGFLVAAKSIFRFGELKDRSDRQLAEYILIGTLLSFLLAMILACGTRHVLGRIP